MPREARARDVLPQVVVMGESKIPHDPRGRRRNIALSSLSKVCALLLRIVS